MIETSAMSGTLVSSNAPSQRIVVAISLSTEFLAPGTTTVPDSGPPPRTTMLSDSEVTAHQYAPIVEPGGRIITRHWPDDDEHRKRIARPRADLLQETEVTNGRTDIGR